MRSKNNVRTVLPKGPIVFRFNSVPIVVQPVFWLQEYYRARSWDPVTGLPTEEKRKG
jgi:hypothetical protein